jgi:hypothetical protein
MYIFEKYKECPRVNWQTTNVLYFMVHTAHTYIHKWAIYGFGIGLLNCGFLQIKFCTNLGLICLHSWDGYEISGLSKICKYPEKFATRNRSQRVCYLCMYMVNRNGIVHNVQINLVRKLPGKKLCYICNIICPWHCGSVASVDHQFESRQAVRLLGLFTVNYLHCYCACVTRLN